jgi:hypothetical protein
LGESPFYFVYLINKGNIMAYTITPLSGIDLNDTQTVAEQALLSGLVTFGPLGAEVFASDGRRYVWAKAGATITTATTTCSINASTFVVTPSAGTYTSPVAAMASGDYGWFSAASV